VSLLGAFAGLALLLASLGLYGVLSYTVGQRTREIGVRMALGAQPGSVVKLVLRYGAKLAGIGLVVGSVIALGAGQLLKTILYQVSPFDPLSFVLVALVLSTIGLLACWAPARNATRINPIEALRAD
jgi:ABC-type antimicrobial peptide transport system permease subunit